MAKREAGIRRREAERVAEQVREAEILACRKRKEEEAERRTQEAGRRAREAQKRQAENRRAEEFRIREEKQREAEKRSQEAIRRQIERQEQAAQKRLAEIAAQEREAAGLAAIEAQQREIMQQWARFRERDKGAEHIKNSTSKGHTHHANTTNHTKHSGSKGYTKDPWPTVFICPHASTSAWWPRKKLRGPGLETCTLCGTICRKFFFPCPECKTVICAECKRRVEKF